MELAHAFLEAEIGHDLPSASVSPRRASAIIQSRSKGRKTRSSHVSG